MLMDRQGLIVWLHSLKHAKTLRRFGNVHYVSRKMKYVLLYCNQNEVEKLADKLTNYSYVKKVDVSQRPFVKTEYENAKPDKAKEYDYKMGL
ncbi:DUF2129 domain-containing protein [Jeotgalibacillus sp. S-D1]|uniref:YlbG family protein n=1 Tax=Jeotgalibacillus sp. S-D1 TaxID=2552189 RepID=UPI00105A13FC|nr:YlbG family protein [Jeotgalibacillus sp. S-D1]TDL35510.1 DUF2129 domain-containing protein [Jeotgalibacillus sp. S-D1]